VFTITHGIPPVPNAVSILGRTYPPGNIRALVFAALGALGPIGFVWGGVVSGLFAKYASIKWIWFFSCVLSFDDCNEAEILCRAILSAVMVVAGYFVLPADERVRSSHTFDVVGTILLALGLGLFNFAWNQGPVAGWSQEYVWALLLVSLAVFGAFFLWERRMGSNALIPLVMMQKNNLLVFLSLWLGWMSLGVYWFYMLALYVNLPRAFQTG
jgi:MFS family permease